MKRILALAAGLMIVAGGSGVAVASSGGADPMEIHLIDAVGFPAWYVQEVKADVEHAYWGSSQPIVFSTRGARVYLEAPGQRAAEGSYFNGTVYCWHSDVGPDTNATVTSTATPEGDAAGVTLAIARVQDARCASQP